MFEQVAPIFLNREANHMLARLRSDLKDMDLDMDLDGCCGSPISILERVRNLQE